MGSWVILQRELRAAAGKPWSYWTRFWAALTMFALVVFLVFVSGSSPGSNQGEQFFLMMAAVSFGFGLLSGPLYSSDILSAEKRNGTLPLLFLANVRSWEVLVAKATGVFVQALSVILAAVPMMAIPLLLGGVTLGQMARVVTVLLMGTLLSLAIGLAISAISREYWRAILGTLVTLLLLVAIPIIATALGLGTSGVWDWTPMEAFRVAWKETGNGAGSALRFRHAIQIQGVVVLLCLGTAAILLSRFWRPENRVGNIGGMPIDRWFGLSPEFAPNVGQRHEVWREQLSANPFYWFAAIVRRPSRGWIFGLMLLMPAWVYCLAMTWSPSLPTAEWHAFLAVGITFGIHTLFKWFAAFAASRVLSEERQQGGLELLLTTPITPEQIKKGQLRYLFVGFRKSVILLITLNVVLILRIGWMSDAGSRSDTGMMLVGLTLGILFLLTDLRALALVGLRQALRSETPQEAFRHTMLQVLVPGWIAWVVMGMMIGFVIRQNSGLYLTMTFILMAIDAFVTRRANVDLDYGFRALAAGLPFDTSGWLDRLKFQRMAEIGHART